MDALLIEKKCRYCGSEKDIRVMARGSVCQECLDKIVAYERWANEQEGELFTCPWCGWEDDGIEGIDDGDFYPECPHCHRHVYVYKLVKTVYVSRRPRKDYGVELPHGC